MIAAVDAPLGGAHAALEPAAASSTQSRSWTKPPGARPRARRGRSPASPRTVRCAARSRRSFTAEDDHQSSATAATPAAARATIPCVEFRSSTAPAYPAAQRVKMTVNSALLLSVTFSPGTGFTCTVIGTFWPVGGCSVERDRDRLRLAGGDLGIVLLGLDGVGALADGHLHAHVGLGALALVHHLDVEGDVRGQRHRRRAARREGHAAERHRAEAVAVRARRGAGAAAPADAGDLRRPRRWARATGCPGRRAATLVDRRASRPRSFSALVALGTKRL